MGFWQRFKRVISSNINALLSRAENPERILEQLLVDMGKQYADAKRQVAASIADEKRLARQLKDEQDASQEWKRKAMLAVRAGDDDLARRALVRKREIDHRVEEFQGQWDQQKSAADTLKDGLRQLKERIEEARRKKTELVARHHRAEAQKEIHDTMVGLGDDSAFATFDEMAEKVAQLEAEAEASAELSETLLAPTLEDELRQLEDAQAGQDLLEAFKAELAGSALPETVDVQVDEELRALKVLLDDSATAVEVEAEENVPGS